MQKRCKLILYGVLVCVSLTGLVLAIVLSFRNIRSVNPGVVTECGRVEGRRLTVVTDRGDVRKVNQFINIPYGAPPTGHLRWKAPVNLKKAGKCWNGTLPYNEEIIQCPQTATDDTKTLGREDCLILNVRSPIVEKSKSLPVLVWIHGGGMFTGHSRMSGYYPDNQFTASMEVVSVSINYRLNIFGFLSLRELWINKTDGGFGNYGIMDQILALHWVKANIRHFGGNPEDVTVFGQAGGGTATYCLLSASLGLAKGLFRKVIASSGAPNIHTTYEEADKRYRPFVEKTNCSRKSEEHTATCLRSLSVTTILANNPGSLLTREYQMTFPTNTNATQAIPLEIIDPLVIQYSPGDHAFLTQQEQTIEILMGNMAQEPMSTLRPKIANWSDWSNLRVYLEPRINTFKKGLYGKLIARYNESRPHDKVFPNTASPYYIYSLMTADIILSCATTDLAYKMAQYKNFKVYSYIVSQALTSIENHTFYAEHSFDVFVLFNFLVQQARHPTYKPTRSDVELKNNLRTKLKSFIHSDEEFESMHRNKTMEFWNSTVITWSLPYHEKECKILRDNGFLKHSWGNLGVWTIS